MTTAAKGKTAGRRRRVQRGGSSAAQALNPGLLTVRAIATAMSVQPGQVRRWIEDGCPVAVKGGPGKSAQLELAAVKTWRAQRQKTVSVAEAGADLKRVQTRRAELDLRRRAGELLDRADVERVWAGHIVDAKTLLEALPRAEAARCVAAARAGGEAAVAQVLDEAIRRVLTALAGASCG